MTRADAAQAIADNGTTEDGGRKSLSPIEIALLLAAAEALISIVVQKCADRLWPDKVANLSIADHAKYWVACRTATRQAAAKLESEGQELPESYGPTERRLRTGGLVTARQMTEEQFVALRYAA